MAFLRDYTNLRMLGRGAFASVYKVRHNELGYVRAIKVLHELIINESDSSWQTFIKECKLLLKIGSGAHPNIVRVYRPLLIESKAMVEMDYVDGISLMEHLKNTPFMEYAEVERFINEIVGAMAYCHHDLYRFLMDPIEDMLEPDPDDARRYNISREKEKELVQKYAVCHNDLHSNNIIRRSFDGTFVLLDFGLAIQNGVSVKSSSRNDGASEYRPPEKWNDQPLTPASDVYALGILLFETLTGSVPFPVDTRTKSLEESLVNVRNQHLYDLPPAIEPLRRKIFEETHPGKEYERDYPEWLDTVIFKALAKSPSDRYANAREMLDDINKYRKADQSDKVDRKVADLSMQLNTVTQQLNQANEEITKIESILQEKERMLADQSNAQKLAADAAKTAHQQSEQTRAEMVMLQTQLDEANHAVEALKREKEMLQTASAQSSDLTKQIEDINGQLQNAMQENRKSAEQYQQQLDRQAESIKLVKQEKAELEKQLDNTVKQLATSKKQLEGSAKENENLKKALEKAQKRQTKVNESGGSLLGEPVAYNSDASGNGKKLWMYVAIALFVLTCGAAAWGFINQSKIDKLNQDIRAAVDMVAEYRKNPEVTEPQEPERVVAPEIIRDTVTVVEHDTVTITQVQNVTNPVNTQLNSQINTLQSRINTLQSQIQTLKTENTKLRRENSSIQERINSL